MQIDTMSTLVFGIIWQMIKYVPEAHDGLF
jgi:hypothetical protein